MSAMRRLAVAMVALLVVVVVAEAGEGKAEVRPGAGGQPYYIPGGKQKGQWARMMATAPGAYAPREAVKMVPKVIVLPENAEKPEKLEK